jgi:hypothetical protein
MYDEFKKAGDFFILSLKANRESFSYIEKYLTLQSFTDGKFFMPAAGF